MSRHVELDNRLEELHLFRRGRQRAAERVTVCENALPAKEAARRGSTLAHPLALVADEILRERGQWRGLVELVPAPAPLLHLRVGPLDGERRTVGRLVLTQGQTSLLGSSHLW